MAAEIKSPRRYRLLIIDEIGYLPLDSGMANRLFQLTVSATNSVRY
ncbi:ATP-binding protein [Gordonia sputi]